MRLPLLFVGIGALVAGALGCGPTENAPGSGPGSCFVDVPCETDPGQTCKVPCKDPVGGGGVGHGGSGGSTGTGTGGTSGAGGKAVDASGITVAFTSGAFDTVTPHTESVRLYAWDLDGQIVTADTSGGAFTMTNVAEGAQWVEAEDTSNGAGQVWSTFSVQAFDGATSLEVPLVPKSALGDVAVQVNVASYAQGAAQLVLRFVDATTGDPVDGVALGALSGAVFAFDTGGPGQYAVNPAQTGPLGMAVVFNVGVPSAQADIELSYSYGNNNPETATLRVGQGMATVAVLPVTK